MCRSSGWLTLILMLMLAHCQQSSDDGLADLLLGAGLAQAASCNADLQRSQANRQFLSGFEAVSDFNGFYLTPQNYQNAAAHELQNTIARTGNAHRGYVYASGPSCPFWQNCNHRGYPTVQLHKSSQGSFRTPVYIEIYTRLDMNVADQQWFSFMTLSADASDSWSRVVLVNLGNLNRGTTNFVHLMHVPLHGQSNWSYQTTETNSPAPYVNGAFVRIEACIDFDPNTGFARVRQNGVLVSEAPVRGACGVLHQAHFGLYAIPTISSGSIYNDDLTIREVSACPF
ncbi:MAG: polysaccharide lyase [Leptospirales bacterium]|nr:polysaccharide lyase [Leptospirales bacterium]